jgi:hypothetical protein
MSKFHDIHGVQRELETPVPDHAEKDAFVAESSAWNTYLRLGYHPTEIDIRTGKPAAINTSDEFTAVRIRANGLAILTCSADTAQSILAKPNFCRSPIFANEDEPTVSFIFCSIGDFDGRVGDYRLRSWCSLPHGFASMERFVELPYPGNGLRWLRPPTLAKSRLPQLPRAIFAELRRSEAGV